MISAAHMIIYSKNAEADRAFFRDVLGFHSVDAGEGWLIFALPPSEIACHPAEENDRHEIFLMCDDLSAVIQELEERGVRCLEVNEQRWGSLTQISLPGGGKLGLYEPKHPVAAH